MAGILVADDEPAIRTLLTDVLRAQGYEVRTAMDGQAALRELEAVRPDFVVLDVMMPRLDGYGVLRAIRERDGDPIPVLMLTGATQADAAAKAWADGVDFYLAKPFSLGDVTSLINSVLGRRPVTGRHRPA